MSDRAYFQWQNPILLKTIYPMREIKLRDFLVFYQEIDIWKELKGKSLDDMPEQVNAYKESETWALNESVKKYKTLRDYFLAESTPSFYSETYPEPDPDELREIDSLHNTFRTYFPNYKDIRKEKNFLSERVRVWNQRRKDAQLRIASQERRVENIAPAHPNRPNEIAKLESMKTVMFAMLEHELAQLEAFEEVIGTLEPRKHEIENTRKAQLRRKDEILWQQEGLSSRIKLLETQFRDLSTELERLKNPPGIDTIEAYLLKKDVSAILRKEYPKINQSLLDTINTVHTEFAENYAYTKSNEGKAGTARTYYWRMREVQRQVQKDVAKREADLLNMPENWSRRAEWETVLNTQRDAGLPVVTAELNKLADLEFVLLSKGQTEEQRAAATEGKQKEVGKAKEALSALKSEFDDLDGELETIETDMAIPDEEKMVTFTPAKEISLYDIAAWKAEQYKASLMDKDQYALLELIRTRFEKEPDRFPLWLQYMVVHFSGMRYATAHGTWADPKDLLVRLRAPDIEKEVETLDDAEVEKLCKEKSAVYESQGGEKPSLVNTTEKAWSQQIGWHMPNMKSSGPRTRRRGLTDMRKLEDAYEIMHKPTQEALDALLAAKEKFPGWAWKQIVRLTPLRVTEVIEPDWEALTPEEEQESYSSANYPLRSMIDAWRTFDATAWREEHGRTHELIVGSLVCNETAEHIQHMRGHLPPGGLTAHSFWYAHHEKEGDVPGEPHPYFVKAKTAEEYIPGASVLWLHFTSKEPNAWQIANQLTTRRGEGLLPAGGFGDASTWTYQMGNTITRKLVGKEHHVSTQTQWLRWLHEATVIEVAETVDGTTVLTFETALPYDDKGTSSIGVFKKPLQYFLSDGDENDFHRSFVGYVPEGNVPMEHINKMLDWGKILLM